MHTDLNRRQFLAAGALTLTAAGLAGCTSTSKTTSFVGPDSAAVEKADPKNVGHVAAPFAGMVSVSVAEGDEVVIRFLRDTREEIALSGQSWAEADAESDSASDQPGT